jgi:hypothetical protein
VFGKVPGRIDMLASPMLGNGGNIADGAIPEISGERVFLADEPENTVVRNPPDWNPDAKAFANVIVDAFTTSGVLPANTTGFVCETVVPPNVNTSGNNNDPAPTFTGFNAGSVP